MMITALAGSERAGGLRELPYMMSKPNGRGRGTRNAPNSTDFMVKEGQFSKKKTQNLVAVIYGGPEPTYLRSLYLFSGL